MPTQERLACVAKAMAEHARRHSVHITAFDKGDRLRDTFGSGTCIKIGGSYFVATAAHVVSSWPETTLALLTSSEPTNRAWKIGRVGRRGGGDYDRIDVAWIEVSEEVANAWGKTFLTVERLGLVKSLAPTRLVAIFGYPLALTRNEQHQGDEVRSHMGLVHLSNVMTEEQAGQPLELDEEFAMDYPAGRNPDAPDGWLDELPDAGRLSGGGIWLIHAAEGSLWAPDHSQLVGIEKCWSSKRRFLKGTYLRHWLRMVAEDHPHLAAEISGLLA